MSNRFRIFTLCAIAAYALPAGAWNLIWSDEFDYEAVDSLCRKYEGFALGVGNAGIGCVINSNGMLRTME